MAACASRFAHCREKSSLHEEFCKRLILPASKRPDLQPVFSFNNEGIFAGVAGTEKATTGGLGRLSRWEDAWQRILAEGYE